MFRVSARLYIIFINIIFNHPCQYRYVDSKELKSKSEKKNNVGNKPKRIKITKKEIKKKFQSLIACLVRGSCNNQMLNHILMYLIWSFLLGCSLSSRLVAAALGQSPRGLGSSSPSSMITTSSSLVTTSSSLVTTSSPLATLLITLKIIWF